MIRTYHLTCVLMNINALVTIIKSNFDVDPSNFTALFKLSKKSMILLICFIGPSENDVTQVCAL